MTCLRSVVFHIWLVQMSETLAKTALDHFVNRHMVYNNSLLLMHSVNASSRATWIEYKFNFETCKDKLKTTHLNVGYFEEGDSEFNCRISRSKNGSVNVAGYSAEVIRLLRERLYFRVKYIKLDNNTREVDIIICNNKNKFEKYLDLPILQSSYAFVYQPRKLHFARDIFVQSFAGSLWFCFLALLTLLGICLRISTRHYAALSPEFEDWSWVDITLWAIAAACQQGLSHTPSKFPSCLMFLLGYIAAYLLNTAFAAGITSLLLQQKFNLNLNQRVHFVGYPNVQKQWFKEMNVVKSMDDFFVETDKINTVGVVPKIYYEEYVSKMRINLNFSYTTSSLHELPYTQSLLILRASPFVKLFNKELTLLKESGILDRTLRKNLKPAHKDDQTSGYSSVGLEHVASAILVLTAGFLAAIVFVIFEFVLASVEARNITQVN